MKKFTEDEKVIAKNIDKEYKWISRNSYGNIYVHKKKPIKSDTCWNEAFSRSGEFFVFNHMFKSIKWEDKEPTLIKDIYNPQILDDTEREYLKAVFKPFASRIQHVRKNRCEEMLAGTEYIRMLMAEPAGDSAYLPVFKAGTMYKGMKLNVAYTLEELGITYDN